MKKGWEIKKLGDVCDFKSGTTIPIQIEKKEGDILYVKVGDMNTEGNEDFITVSSRFVNSNDINLNQIIPVGAIIFPKRGGAIATNKKRRIIKPTIVDLNTMALIPTSIIDKDYLHFWFQLIDLSELSNGTSIPQINNYSFDNIFIAYPKSLTEQRNIVSILDEAFTVLDQAKENLHRNLQNAKGLFQSELNNIFTSNGDGWVEKRFEELIKENQIGLIRNAKEQGEDRKYRYLKMNAITIENTFLESKCVRVDASEEEVKKFTLDEGDFLFNTRNSYELVGKTCVFFSNEKETTLFNNNIMRVKFKDDYNSQFINYAFTSVHVKESLEKIKSGTTSVVGIYFHSLKKLLVPIPSLKEQKKIVNQLDTLSAETQNLENIYQQKLDNLEELKKSILQKAFRGELTIKRTALT